MRFTKRPSELGEEWYDQEPPRFFYTTIIVAVIGLLILFFEWSGAADALLASFM